MSTSPEPDDPGPAPDPVRDFDLQPRRLDDPDVVALIEEVQQEYVRRYGGPDASPVEPAQFAPPRGFFLLGLLGGDPVAMGGWRSVSPDTVEVKRMYVAPRAQRRGLARRVLAALEDEARATGHARVILETGRAQPEAIALYATQGYREITPFGHYADVVGSVHLGKDL